MAPPRKKKPLAEAVEELHAKVMPMQGVPDRIVAHILGYIEGAFAFGGTPETVREALYRDFPRLTADQVDIAIEEMLPRVMSPEPPPRILS